MRPTPHVVDASVVVPLILPAPGDDDQLGLDALIDDPDVDVFAPTIMDLEVLNVAARRRGLSEDQLVRLVEALERLTITRTDPDLDGVARWSSRGLSAYDASYAALSAEVGGPVLTNDGGLRRALDRDGLSR